MKDLGLKPTDEFESYVRTTRAQNKCEFRKIQSVRPLVPCRFGRHRKQRMLITSSCVLLQSLRVAQGRAEPTMASVRPIDVNFSRGQGGIPAKVDPDMDPETQQLS